MSHDNTWEFVRRAQLARFVETLGDVLAILRLDPQCEWTAQFGQLLEASQKLANDGFTQADINELSRSACRALSRRDGEFRHYVPPAELPTAGLHGTDNFETFAQAAYEQSLQLRVIVHQHVAGISGWNAALLR